MPRRLGLLSVLALVSLSALLVVNVAAGSAAVRFAGPGGTGKDPCADPAKPCSIANATDAGVSGTSVKAGDEVVLAPGTYSDADIFATLEIPAGVAVHGASGQPRPRFVLNSPSGKAFPAFLVDPGASLSHLEIESTVRRSEVSIVGGTVSDLIARATLAPGAGAAFVCEVRSGVLRDSACLGAGEEIAAVGLLLNTDAPSLNVSLRNLTAVATGLGSVGVKYATLDRNHINVQADGVIASGEGADLFLRGVSPDPHLPGTGSVVRVDLSHSDYLETTIVTDPGSAVTVTPPGSGTNITAPPLLDADGIHQLPGSPTIDAGPPLEPGTTDIDGEFRSTGVAPDIGADERPGIPTPTPTAPPAPAPRPVEPGGGNGGGPAPIAPQTKLGKVPAKVTNSRTAVFAFSSNEPGSRFQCKLDAKPYAACRSPFKRSVAPGAHVYRVRATNVFGKTDPTPAAYRWKVVPR